MNEFLLDFRQYFLVAHIFALALGLGGAIMTDFMFMRFLKDNKVSPDEKETLDGLSMVIWTGFGLLVVTGLGLFIPNMQGLLRTPVFLAKLTSLAVILVNACFLNFYIAPKLTTISFDNPAMNAPAINRARKLSPVFGGISMVSWLYTFFLGAMMSYLDYSYATLILVYVALLACGIAGAMVVTKLKFKPKINP